VQFLVFLPVNERQFFLINKRRQF